MASNRSKIAYLKRYGYYNREIDRLLEEQARWKSRAEKMTPASTGLPGGNGEDTIQTAIEKIIELEDKINNAIDRMLDAKSEIERAIDGIGDDKLVELMRRRYINRHTWERIAVDMHFGYRWVMRLHVQALSKMSIENRRKP